MFNQLVYTLQQVRQLGSLRNKNAFLLNAGAAVKQAAASADSASKRLFQAGISGSHTNRCYHPQVDIALEYRGE